MRKGNFNLLAGYDCWAPSWGGCFGLLGWLLVGAILGNIVTGIFQVVAGQAAALEYGTVISYPLMFLPAMFWARSKSMHAEMGFEVKRVPVNNGHYAPVGFALCAVVVSLMTLASGFVVEPLVSLLPQMPEWLEVTLKSMTTGNVFINLLCVSVFAPFFEEWLCRGMVLRGLLSKGVKPVWAILFSAVFFAVIHANPWQAVPAFALGAIFGYVYYKTGSLTLTMLMHCVNNTFAVICGQIDSLSEMESWMDVLSPSIYWALFGVLVIVLALGIRTIGRVNVVDTKDVSPAE